MKILQVNKFYYPKDGVSNYLLGLEAKLKDLGHEVRVFAMDNPKNISSDTQKYFVSYLSFDKKGLLNAWRSFARIFYSLEAKRKFSSLIEDYKPDIIHIHNIYHQISPSILSVAKKKNIPVIMHLHDYKLICPNYKLFTEGSICRRCQGGRYYNCASHKCLKNSYPKSIAATLEMYFHHDIWKIYKSGVKLFIAPSRFMKKTCEEFGWPAEKIICLHNFFNDQGAKNIKTKQDINHEYLFYFGRLSEEKGVNVLLNALSENKYKLKIAGEGPEETKLKNLSTKLGLNERIEFLGFKSGEELDGLISNAKAIIIPSIWYENMPLNMLEAMAREKIVIASNIGGMPEIINDGQNGLLFKAGDKDDLITKLKLLDDLDTKQMGERAAEAVKNLNADTHVKEIIKIYEQVLK
ncbi:MAG: glycosyltransferase [Candidatus Falkowbacteria bacterium]